MKKTESGAIRDTKTDLPGISSGDLSALLYGGAGLMSPFSKEIYIGRQSIVGMRFQGGAQTLVKELKPGDRITLLREPENEYDDRAIIAMDEAGRKLGYIPRRENLVMSALMDHGKVFFGVIPDVPKEEYVYSRKYPDQMIESEIGIPVTVTVDLYMREFAVPGDMRMIPRYGSDGSYAVVSLWLSDDEPDRIRRLCAIKVINGEERGLLDKRISAHQLRVDTDPEQNDQKREPYDQNREAERKALLEFHAFIGYLPIVSHGINGSLRKALEESYGVLLGMPFSNLIIDTEEMARNHLPGESERDLGGLARRLRIHVSGDSHAERCCRRTWELYRRMCK